MSILATSAIANNVHAQILAPGFSLPYDTICVNHEFVPNLLVQNAQSYDWTFCPPQLGGQPQGENLGVSNFLINVNNCIGSIQVDSFQYMFSAGIDGKLIRYQFVNGLEDVPQVTDLGHFNFNFPANASGIHIIQQNGIYSVFAIGYDIAGVPKFMRIDMANGLNQAPTGYHVYSNLTAALHKPTELFITKENGKYYGITFNNGKELVRMDFDSLNLDATPTLTNLGNISDAFDDVSAIAPIYEMGNWHLMVTNKESSELTHLTFGNSITNTPFAINLGNFDDKIRVPSAISITKNCNDYYGYVLNYLTGEWTTLYWSESIAGVPVANSNNGFGNIDLPNAMSSTFRDQNGVYTFVMNEDRTLTRAKILNCTDASYPGFHGRTPDPVSYGKAGMYTVFLTVNEGQPTVNSYCKNIYVKDHPDLTITEDTILCAGNILPLQALTFATDSITWSPNYNIDTTHGRFVKVWPNYSTDYIVNLYYAENCNVKETIKVTVENVKADAGADQYLNDGSIAIIGGPQTTLDESFQYEWTPNVHFLSDNTKPIAKVKPQSNITYYLNVTGPLGCKAIDSVYVAVPCDNIVMANAFMPETQPAYRVQNEQLTQVNFFRIFDRWGREVFSTNNPQIGWNGRDLDGNVCPGGVYVWDIDAYCKDTNQRYHKSGNVTVIR